MVVFTATGKINRTRSYTNIGEMENYLYVSDYPEEWEMDKQDVSKGCQYTYVFNKDMPECSEFGTIGIALTDAASLHRIWQVRRLLRKDL